eukprot:TRINITY_DN4129_c0_g3_i1.p1 TRINITY_DN4129_c0_g3~~TRINITY_DN4129_c0_g3_i1.p1  ORF type:complete len:131 (-),score=41.80 TRINITY_DN4129_c0_g3_i1:92-484(-)
MIEYANKEYNSLKMDNPNESTIESLSKQVQEVFWYTIEESKGLKHKYEKLLKLHNRLIENNGLLDEKYNVEYIYKLADENEFLRAELGRTIHQNAICINNEKVEERKGIDYRPLKARKKPASSKKPKRHR